MTGRLDTETVARARTVPVVHEIHRRRIPLRRVGLELIGACPVCGDGGKGSRSDRFAVHLRKNAWLCRRCEKGGGVVDLVMHLDSIGFQEAVARLVGGGHPASTPHPAPALPAPASDDEQERVRNALRLWEEAGPIAGTIAEQYLRAPRSQGGRAINLSSDLLPPDISPRVLRFHPSCFFEGPRHPCLLALYRSIVGDEPTGIMRTALTPDARKIDRKGAGKLKGSAIKLSDDADVTMGLTIGEGLETTLAGMMFGFAPAWALGSAGGIMKFPVLSGIEALTILAETDDDRANERAIQECFDRWTAAGREVLRATPEIGGDANDALTTDLT